MDIHQESLNKAFRVRIGEYHIAEKVFSESSDIPL